MSDFYVQSHNDFTEDFKNQNFIRPIFFPVYRHNFRGILRKLKLNLEEYDLMEWWRKHEFYFPHDAKLARKYLAIPASLDCTSAKNI